MSKEKLFNALDELHCTAYRMKSFNKSTIKAEKLMERSIDKLDEYEKAIKIIKNKLMYEVEPFDFMDYDTYEDYYQNYFEQRYEEENNYPDWWLTKEEFELLKSVFKGK